MQKYVIALYIRLSIEDYKYDSLSIENQSLVLHEYAASMPEALNAEIMEFIDNGYSGTNFERPQVQKLIELVRANQIDCIIVKDFSRCGRNSIETGYFIERVFPLFHTMNHFYDVILNYMDALKARPEINSAQTTFNPNFPQYMLDIDAAACKKAGISPNDILTTMQGYFGGLYASNFNRFGKMYRVMIQAEPEATKNLESLNSIKIRNGNEMAPISQFVSIKKVYGPDVISRFNLYTSIKVMVAPASGYTSGQALHKWNIYCTS